MKASPHSSPSPFSFPSVLLGRSSQKRLQSAVAWQNKLPLQVILLPSAKARGDDKNMRIVVAGPIGVLPGCRCSLHRHCDDPPVMPTFLWDHMTGFIWRIFFQIVSFSCLGIANHDSKIWTNTQNQSHRIEYIYIYYVQIIQCFPDLLHDVPKILVIFSLWNPVTLWACWKVGCAARAAGRPRRDPEARALAVSPAVYRGG
jgi:hypothetical protein